MEKVQGAKCGELKKAEYQKPMGPAPFASFEDLSDEMDSLEEHDNNKLQSISEVEPTSISPKSSETLNLPNQFPPISTTPVSPVSNNNIPPSLLHSPMYNKVNVKLSNAPRIDISRASSSSHHDSRDSSPERELLDNIDAPNSKLGMGFKEDGAIDLKSSTEELDFHEPYEYRKSRDRTCSSPVPDDTYVDHRKDSQCSDVVLLSISGRTSRLSSIGSQGSAKSRLSNASHLSIVSAQSAYSRCSSPHKTLLETSFCGSKNDCRGDLDNTSTKGESEEFEKMLLSSRNSDSSDVVLLDTFNLSSPKQTTAPAELVTSRKVTPSKEKGLEKVNVKENKDVKEEPQIKIPRKIISKSGVEYIYIPLKGPLPVDDSEEEPVAKSSTRHTSNTLKVSEKGSHAKQKNIKRDVTPKQMNVSVKMEEPKYIRIKLKPDHCYDDNGDDYKNNKDKPSSICQNNQCFSPLDNIMKPNTLNLPFSNDGIVHQPDDQLTCVVVRKQARSLTNTPSVSPKFGRRKVSTTKDTLSPSPSVSRRNSFACLFKTKDLVTSPESPNMARHKRKNTLSGILKTPTSRPKNRSKSKDREKAPSSTESIDSKGRHKSVLSIFRAKDKPVVDSTAQGGSSKKTLAKKRGAAVNNIHIPSSKERDQEVPLNSDSIRIPLHSPTYYDEMSARDKWSIGSDPDRIKQMPTEHQIPPTVVAMTEKKDKPKKTSEVIPNNIPEPAVEVKTTIIIEDPPKCRVVEEQIKIPPKPVVAENQVSIPSSESVTSTISTITTTVLSQMGNGTRNIPIERAEEVVIKSLAVRRNISGEDELNSSESERDSVEDYVKCPKNLTIHVESESLEIEREAIVLQQDSFEDELPYIPTTLPLERSAAVPIIPVKQRSVSNIKTFSIDRPRSTTPIQSSALENYCDDFVGKTKIESKVTDPNTEKIKITLPEKKALKECTGDGPTTEDAPPPLPPKRVQNTWVNFEELPERRKPPKRIQTIPSRGHIDVPEFMVKDNVVYTYVNPEECKCECHEFKDKERRSGSDTAVKEEITCEEGTSDNCKENPKKELKQHR